MVKHMQRITARSVSLSAIGSNALPKGLTWLNRLAINPSTISVRAEDAKRMAESSKLPSAYAITINGINPILINDKILGIVKICFNFDIISLSKNQIKNSPKMEINTRV